MRILMPLLLLLVGAPAGVMAAAPDISAEDMLARQQAAQPLLVVDVRSPEEFAAGHVPGAVNLPHDRLTGNESALKDWKHKTVVLYCRSGRRAALAAETLEKQGFSELRHLQGDMQGWQGAGRVVQQPAGAAGTQPSP